MFELMKYDPNLEFRLIKAEAVYSHGDLAGLTAKDFYISPDTPHTKIAELSFEDEDTIISNHSDNDMTFDIECASCGTTGILFIRAGHQHNMSNSCCGNCDSVGEWHINGAQQTQGF
jgi:hypothetical protein